MILQVAPAAVVVVLMFTVGLSIRPQAVRDALAKPAMLLVLVGGQVLLMPILGAALAWLVAGSAASASLWILLLATCPGGAISNALVLYGRGDVALSVVLTAATSLLAAASMPAVLLALHAAGLVPALEVPAPTLVGQAFALLLVPCAAGMLVRHAKGGATDVLVRRLGAIGALLLVLTLAVAIVEQRESLRAIWWPAVLVAGLFVMAAGGLGAGIAWIARLDGVRRFTVVVEFAVRNVAAAFAISILSFGRDDFAAFGAVYLLAEIAILATIAAARRRRRPIVGGAA